jgi:hypothetical protein
MCEDIRKERAAQSWPLDFAEYRALPNLMRQNFTAPTDEQRRLASFATIHTRGAGKLSDREVAHGTLEDMLKWFLRVEPSYQRNLILVKDSMEFRPAEVESLALQLGVKLKAEQQLHEALQRRE